MRPDLCGLWSLMLSMDFFLKRGKILLNGNNIFNSNNCMYPVLAVDKQVAERISGSSQ